MRKKVKTTITEVIFSRVGKKEIQYNPPPIYRPIYP